MLNIVRWELKHLLLMYPSDKHNTLTDSTETSHILLTVYKWKRELHTQQSAILYIHTYSGGLWVQHMLVYTLPYCLEYLHSVRFDWTILSGRSKYCVIVGNHTTSGQIALSFDGIPGLKCYFVHPT